MSHCGGKETIGWGKSHHEECLYMLCSDVFVPQHNLDLAERTQIGLRSEFWVICRSVCVRMWEERVSLWFASFCFSTHIEISPFFKVMYHKWTHCKITGSKKKNGMLFLCIFIYLLMSLIIMKNNSFLIHNSERIKRQVEVHRGHQGPAYGFERAGAH